MDYSNCLNRKILNWPHKDFYIQDGVTWTTFTPMQITENQVECISNNGAQDSQPPIRKNSNL